MRSISRGVTGRVRDCSRSRFMTWVVNSVHAWGGGGKRRHTLKGRNAESSKARFNISYGFGTTLLKILDTKIFAILQV